MEGEIEADEIYIGGPDPGSNTRMCLSPERPRETSLDLRLDGSKVNIHT